MLTSRSTQFQVARGLSSNSSDLKMSVTRKYLSILQLSSSLNLEGLCPIFQSIPVIKQLYALSTNLTSPFKTPPNAEIEDDPGQEKAEEKRPVDLSYIFDAW